MIINGNGSNQLLGQLDILCDENTAAYKTGWRLLEKMFFCTTAYADDYYVPQK